MVAKNKQQPKARKGANGNNTKPIAKPGGRPVGKKPRRKPAFNGPKPRRVQAAAAAYSRGQGFTEPRIQNMGRDGVRIQHRELVGSLTGSTAFVIARALALNPGLASTFPWLSTQAKGWEQYRFNSLRLEYFSRTGSGTPGSVMLAPDYDAADAAPTTEQQMSAYRDVEEEAPWVPEFCCDCNVSAMHPDGRRKFVRTGALGPNLDVKTYDVGNMFVATVDGTAVGWGKMWLSYDVSLFVPQLPDVVADAATGSIDAIATPGQAAATPFGNQSLSGSGAIALQSNGALAVTVDGLVIGQEYQVDVLVKGTVITNELQITANTWGTAKTAWTGIDGTAIESVFVETFTATATSGTITLGSLVATTVTNCRLTVALMPTTTN